MDNTKHIFIQIDTDSIIKDLGPDKLTNSQVREHTYIYDQGSMAMGNVVQTFSIYVEPQQDIYFTILPLRLFSYHRLYFTKFSVDWDPNDGIVVPPVVTPDGHALSFKVTVASVSPGAEADFCLYAVIEYRLGDQLIQVPICIDPVLKAHQG